MTFCRLWCVLGVVVSLGAGAAQAQRSRADARVLAGHPFMPSGLVEQPFNVRSYGMFAGAGFATLDSPDLEDPLTFAALSLATETQQPIWRMIALRLGLSGTALVGTDENTGLNFGAQGGYNAFAGVLVNAVNLERFSLSASVDVGGGQSYRLSPLESIQRSIDAGEITVDTLVIQTNVVEVAPTVSLGVGFFEAMGAYAAFTYTFQRNDSDGVTTTGNQVAVGLGLSLNFDPYAVPLGFNLAYQYQTEFGNEDPLNTNSVEIGLFYAAGKHFAFGIDGAIQLGRYDESGFDLRTYLVQLGMEFYE